jgi:hypothetical protein
MIHQRTVKNEIDLAEKKILLGQTNSSSKLSISQSEFSDALGKSTRTIKIIY